MIDYYDCLIQAKINDVLYAEYETKSGYTLYITDYSSVISKNGEIIPHDSVPNQLLTDAVWEEI